MAVRHSREARSCFTELRTTVQPRAFSQMISPLRLLLCVFGQSALSLLDARMIEQTEKAAWYPRRERQALRLGRVK